MHHLESIFLKFTGAWLRTPYYEYYDVLSFMAKNVSKMHIPFLKIYRGGGAYPRTPVVSRFNFYGKKWLQNALLLKKNRVVGTMPPDPRSMTF